MDSNDICQAIVTGKVISEPTLLGDGSPQDPFMCNFELAVNAISETRYFQALITGEQATDCALQLRVGDQVAISGVLIPQYRDEPGSREVEEIYICGTHAHFLPSGPGRGQGQEQGERREIGQPEVPVP